MEQNKMVVIKSLEQAEIVVLKNSNNSGNSSLKWDGWDILEVKLNPSGSSRSDGLYIGGKWYTHRRFRPSEGGWSVPRRYVK
jgi:hypothetical protein